MGRALTAVVLLAAGLSVAPLVPASASPAQPGYTFRTFDVPGATGTQVNGVNDGGVIEGAFTDASGQHGFVAGPVGLARFDFPGTSGVTQAFAIDNAGDVVGVYTDAAGASHGFRRSPGGAITALPPAPGAGTGSGQGTFPTGITDSGQIVGFYVGADGVAHGYAQRPDGRFTVINAPGAGEAAGQGTVITATNDQLTLAGFYITSSGADHGLLAHPR